MTNHGSPSGGVRNIFFSTRGPPQVHPMTTATDAKDSSSSSSAAAADDAFHRDLAERLRALAEAGDEELLSLAWLRRAMEVFLEVEAEFRELGALRSAPRARAVVDFMDKGLKALDVCNAIRDGLEQVRLWRKHMDIVLCALDLGGGRSPVEPHIRRARKALLELQATVSAEDSSPLALRNRSFARGSAWSPSSGFGVGAAGQMRSLSWSVSRSWSAGKQLQAMAANLGTAPRGADAAAAAVYGMSHALVLAAWLLVATIPCQDRGIQVHFGAPRGFPWAAPVQTIHDRVMEESRKRHRRSNGHTVLLREICHIGGCVRRLLDLTELSGLVFPLPAHVDGEIRSEVAELRREWSALRDGLEPLERQVREFFRRIAAARTEVLDSPNRYSANHE